MFTGRTQTNLMRRTKPKVIGYPAGHPAGSGGYLWMHLTMEGTSLDFTTWREAMDSALREAELHRFHRGAWVHDWSRSSRGSAA